jgi:ATP/maltotriose-dependent transcriptional regulator MalT
MTHALCVLGYVAYHRQDYTGARRHYDESLMMAKELGDKGLIAFGLERLANVVAAQGEPEWAARLWGAAEGMLETPILPIGRADSERAAAAARLQLGETAFFAAWAEGRAMPLEQVLAAHGSTMPSLPDQAALPSTPPKGPNHLAGLTAREVEVLRPLAQGLTSVQIAEQLVIGLVTVNSHVRSIYSKLGVSSRSAATRYSMEHHLL